MKELPFKEGEYVTFVENIDGDYTRDYLINHYGESILTEVLQVVSCIENNLYDSYCTVRAQRLHPHEQSTLQFYDHHFKSARDVFNDMMGELS